MNAGPHIVPLAPQSTTFASVTLPDGEPFDFPAASIIFVEALDPAAKEANPGAKGGLFYDLGQSPNAILTQEPFGKLAKVAEAARPGAFVTLTTSLGQRTMLLKHNIIALRGLAGDDAAKCQLTHRVGQQTFTLNVSETRDAIRELIGNPVEAAAELEEENGSEA